MSKRKKRWDRKKERKQKNTLHDDVHTQLLKMYEQGKGRSRRIDKAKREDNKYIYSSRTYETYKANGKLFVDYVKKTHPKVLHLKDCKPFANEWIQYLIDSGYSPWTISTRKAAVAKLLDIPYTDLIVTPSRCRAQIQRSRAVVERDRHISKEKESFYSKITSATGLRRNELIKIKGSDLRKSTMQDGTEYYYLSITKGTKGGRHRTALICGATDSETKEIVRLFQQKRNTLVCAHLSSAYDNHADRAKYAQRLYCKFARPAENIPSKDRYVMRKDRAGEVLDRRAMKIVSSNMGHSRIDVIAQSYLY